MKIGKLDAYLKEWLSITECFPKWKIPKRVAPVSKEGLCIGEAPPLSSVTCILTIEVRVGKARLLGNLGKYFCVHLEPNAT